jgi:sugar lactone lactonase YvrE
MPRKSTAALCVIVVAILLACSRNGPPDPLFETAGYHVNGGKVWYVDYTRGYLGRLDPATSKVDEWQNPSGAQSMPYAMTVDDRDRIWYVETGIQPNRLVGFDPKQGKVFSITPISQSGGLTVRHMIYHAPTKSIWFGTDANTIGQAKVEPTGERGRTISD